MLKEEFMPSTLLDTFLPIYDCNEVHSITVRASASDVFAAIKELTPSELSLLVHILFAIRTLPTRFMRTYRKPLQSEKPILEQIVGVSFLHLAEVPNRELVIGTIGQFWRLLGSTERKPAQTPQEFLAFNKPGFAKSVMNFRLIEENNCVRVITETRIQALDASARRKFALYWKLVYPGSALIRVLWLRAIKRRADRVNRLSK